MNTTRILEPTGPNTCAEEKDSSIMWLAEECLNNGATLDTHLEHAERTGDTELAQFFRRAQRAIKQAHNRRARNPATDLLTDRPLPLSSRATGAPLPPRLWAR
jgi:hypothetical protein